MNIWRALALTFCFISILTTQSAASGKSEAFAAICERAAEQAAAQSGVPVSVLKAISLNETGTKLNNEFRPWAWTVNMEGKGFWFDTLDEARAYVFKEYKRGARSFDLGCFQINYKWHGHEFSSIDAMFDPLENGLYAARFLKSLYQETGDWTKAAGAYHSRTRKYADKYAARFNKFRSKFLTEDKSPPPASYQPLPDAGVQVARNDDIPEIPDIVAANTITAPQRPKRINNFPLFVRREDNVVSTGNASGASLFAAAIAKTEVN